MPQRADEGLFPVPPDCALDQSFDVNSFTGRWYITAGLNPLFDTFDCQVKGGGGAVLARHCLTSLTARWGTAGGQGGAVLTDKGSPRCIAQNRRQSTKSGS